MWNIEDVLSELAGEEELGKLGLAAGFRFHPTDEELISYYLASKVFNHYPSSSSSTTTTTSSSPFLSFSALNIPQVDLNRIEPWDLPETAKIGEREWYFYSVRDRKYPTGLRTNRATATGYWKATGKDKHVYSSNNNNNKGVGVVGLIGMKKTLVFYQGRAPRGLKTPWVMHEYRLDGHFSSFRLSSSKEEWVICRIFHKNGIGSGNENKKPIRASFHNYNNFMMMNSSSSIPPLLEAATTTSIPAIPQPPLFFNDDFGLNPLPSITTTTTMKQEQNDQQHLNWLEKIITPQHQLFNNNPLSFYHHNPGLGLCLDYNLRSEIALSKSSQEFHGDFLHTTNNVDIPDASVSLAALDPLINLVP